MRGAAPVPVTISRRGATALPPGRFTKQWYGKRKVAERYGCSMRTVERWVKLGRFPKPVRMPNGRDYWADETIEEHERSLVTDDA